MSDAVQRLADEAEIRNLLARIAQLSYEGELDDRARVRSVFFFYRETRAIPKLDRMGVHEDSLRRTPSGWKRDSRTIVQPE